jgi:glycosyltransferase involved in cell wall biosynthesis
MKNVFLKGRSEGGIPHSLYRGLLRFPPDGYSVFTRNTKNIGKQQTPSLTKRKQLFYDLNRKLQGTPYDRLWYEARTLFYMGLKKTQRSRLPSGLDIDLVFSSQQLMFTKIPWVVDFEYANALVDYGDIRLCRRFIQKALGSSFCKKIMPWSEWSKRTLLQSMNCGSFKEKIEVVHFGMEPKEFIKKNDDGKVRILFVGSTNQFNYLIFEWKGGFEVVEAFLELNKKYNDLELVLASWVPPEIRKKCFKNPNIKISFPLSEQELTSVYASTNICLYPTYMNLSQAILEAMSFELPVVTSNIYDIPEAIENMKSGVLLDCPNLPLYLWNGTPNHHDENLSQIRRVRPWRVKQIVEKLALLIEDNSLRRKIGRTARHLIESGEFSIKNRNEKLKRIFDDATEISLQRCSP